jgi:hypothetical protein
MRHLHTHRRTDICDCAQRLCTVGWMKTPVSRSSNGLASTHHTLVPFVNSIHLCIDIETRTMRARAEMIYPRDGGGACKHQRMTTTVDLLQPTNLLFLLHFGYQRFQVVHRQRPPISSTHRTVYLSRHTKFNRKYTCVRSECRSHKATVWRAECTFPPLLIWWSAQCFMHLICTFFPQLTFFVKIFTHAFKCNPMILRKSCIA